MGEAVAETGSNARGNRKRVVGLVVSDKCDKTITVSVDRLSKHPRYGKYIRRSTRFAAHDEKNEAREGDRVEIMETRRISKRKRWRLISIVEKTQR